MNGLSVKHVGAEGLQGDVIGTGIHVGGMHSALSRIAEWATKRESRSVFFCNAHSLAHARSHRHFHAVLASGDLRLPDGAPVAYMLRRAGFEGQRRVCGPDLMLEYMALAEARDEAVFLYGSTPEILAKLQARYARDFPRLKVRTYSPPFRALTQDEDEDIVRLIADSGSPTVWVALGCPKQEQWIAEHRDRLPAVLLGVGAAFAFHAGVSPRAPRWMQKTGLEWLHRLASDPARMWKRYLVTNSSFLFYSVLSAARRKIHTASPSR